MSYQVKQGNIFGRLGSGIGQGLAEQVPKEIERTRLSRGLENLAKESAGLTPFQRFSKLAGIPGITPQAIQSGSELLRQEARANALTRQGEGRPSPFPQKQPGAQPAEPTSKVPSLTEEEAFRRAQEGYIPPSQEDIYDFAGQEYNKNPALFDNDPQKAIDFARNKAAQDEKIAEAYQRKHENLDRIQQNVVNRLKDHSQRLNVQIPALTYSKIEDKAIQATKPKNLGGRGLTEQQAMKEYGEELDKISRDYQSIDNLGNWGIVAKPASDTLTSIKSLQNKFKENDDLENFADTLISNTKISPKLAYSLAYPISQNSYLNKEFKNIPDIKEPLSVAGKKPKNVDQKTLEISERLAPLLGDKGSPLSVAYELEKKGYNPNIWLNYIIDHRDDLDLKESQGRQLDKPNALLGTMNDWWLSSFSGIQ